MSVESGSSKTVRRIFVSYSHPDASWARWIASCLRNHGHHVVVQADDFLPGRNFVVEMRQALADVDHVVAVLTPDYEASGFALAEWADAFAGDPFGRHRRLIGVKVADYRPGPLMRAAIYVDLFGLKPEEAERSLLRAIVPEDFQLAPAEFPGRIAKRSSLVNRPSLPPNCVWIRDHLTELTNALSSRRRAVITGIGGLGKTSLALQVLEEVEDDFDVVIWMHGEDRDAMELAGVRAAINLDLATADDDPLDAIAALRAGASADWLVVVDDCPSAAVVAELLPDATVLATSRNDRGWAPGGFDQVRLRPWSREEVNLYLSSAAPSAVDAGEELTERLGGLPLAVAQAAAYIDATGLTGSEYLARLDEYAAELFSDPADERYGRTVLSVWALSLDHLRRDEPYAAQILDLLAFLGRSRIPLDFVRSVRSMPEPFESQRQSDPATDRALSALLRQSLCSVEPGGVTVHPLIQSSVASRLGGEQLRATLSALVEALIDAAPASSGAEAWEQWDDLGPLVLAVFGALSSVQLGVAGIRPVATALAEALSEKGFVHASIALRSEVLAYIMNLADDFAADDLAAASHDLANSYAAVQMSEAAVKTYRMAIHMDDVLDQRQTARSLASVVGLVGALTDTGDVTEAATLIEEAAAVWKKHHDGDAELGLMIYGTWGRLMTRIGRAGDARPHLQMALGLAKACDRPSEVAITLLHLGNADLAEDKVGEAQALYVGALDALRSAPDARHLKASILQNLAGTHLRQSRREDAYDCLTAALDELSHLPDGDTSVLGALLHFTRARVDLSWGRPVEPIIVEAGQALDVLCAYLPRDHPHRVSVARFLTQIADGLQDERLREEVRARQPPMLES